MTISPATIKRGFVGTFVPEEAVYGKMKSPAIVIKAEDWNDPQNAGVNEFAPNFSTNIGQQFGTTGFFTFGTRGGTPGNDKSVGYLGDPMLTALDQLNRKIAYFGTPGPMIYFAQVNNPDGWKPNNTVPFVEKPLEVHRASVAPGVSKLDSPETHQVHMSQGYPLKKG